MPVETPVSPNQVQLAEALPAPAVDPSLAQPATPIEVPGTVIQPLAIEAGPAAAEQAAGPNRLAQAAAWAAKIVTRAVEVVPAAAARLENAGAVGQAIEKSRALPGRSKWAVLVGAQAVRFAAGVHEARGYGLSGKRAAAYAGARTVRRHYSGRHR